PPRPPSIVGLDDTDPLRAVVIGCRRGARAMAGTGLGGEAPLTSPSEISGAAHFDSTVAEEKWSRHWLEQGAYRFDESKGSIFAIDTPPPTVSGSLHVGHVFSYAQTDVLARYQRMLGRNVFYPMG